MGWTFKQVDHTADIAFDIEADSLNELFVAAAFAWGKTISDEKFFESASEKNIFLEENSIEILLVSFISELNYLFQNEKWMMTSVKNVELQKANETWKLSTLISGFIFDRSRIKLKSEIKAVTYHQMEIKKEKDKFSTRVVFDI